MEYDESRNVYTSDVVVLLGGLDITITPVATLRDKSTLKFDAENGTMTPSEQKSFYKNESFDIKFTATSGYAFYEWKLLDFQNNELNISDYLEIDPKKEEQTVKVKATGAVLTLQGCAVARPQVKFTIPANGKEGLVRNATIKILFTKQMDKTTLTKAKIKVTQGLLRSTEQDIFIDAQDATGLLDYNVNDACDLLTIKLKNVNTLYQPNAYVTVTVSKDVKDNQTFIKEAEDRNLRSVKNEYWPDAWPSRTSSGIAQYYISRNYNDWRSAGDKSCWQPVFPQGTDLSGISLSEMQKERFLSTLVYDFVCWDSTWLRSNKSGVDPTSYYGTWVDYDVNKDGDIEIPIWRNPFGSSINYHYSAPIAVCFKDGCGNLSFVNITKPTWSEYAGFAYRFDFYGENY